MPFEGFTEVCQRSRSLGLEKLSLENLIVQGAISWQGAALRVFITFNDSISL